MAVPVFCKNSFSSNLKTLLCMIMRKASLMAVIGLLVSACRFRDMNALILVRAAVVFMLVYMDVASAINKMDPGGT